MSVFWGLAGIMIIIALLFTVPWLLRAGRSAPPPLDQDALNTEVIKAQLAELDTDLKTGRLDETQYAAARRDLERELLTDLAPAGRASASKPPRSGQWAVLLLVAVIPLLAVLLYQHIGSKEIIPLLEQRGDPASTSSSSSADTTPPHEMGEQTLEGMVNVLAARLKDKPNDLQGWVLLARSYETLHRYADALNAYGNARRLSGDNPGLLADYADALVMANGGRFNDEAGELLEQAIKGEPNNVKALWLAGHWKNQQGSYQEALDYWQRAAALLPAGSEDSTVIAQQISQVQQRLGITPAAAPALAAAAPAGDGGKPAAGGGALSVTVALDPALAAKAKPEDTVFIFARAVQGPRMPLAILRKQVKDLPVTVTLDDSLAMSPAMTLSKFDQVTVGARISATGNAMPQSGDLEGSQSPVGVANSTPVAITIDRTVP